LTTITSIRPHHVLEQTLPLLFRFLPDTAPPRAAAGERAKYWRTLSILQTLCVQSELFENLVIRLTTKLDLICLPSSIAASDDIEPDAAYAHAILKTLSQTLAVKVQRKDPDIVKYIDRLVPHIFNLFISSIFLAKERPVITTDPRLLQVAGEIITLVVQSLPLELVKSQHVYNYISSFFSSARRQKSYSIGISKALIEGDVADIAQGFQKIVNHQKLSIFTVTLFSPLPGILTNINGRIHHTET
jgi:DNA repair/transcription protein MET18/MMS19